MATLQEENRARADLKAVLSELANLKASNMARQELGSDLNFENGVIFFSRILRLFHTLNDANLDDVSYQRITQITSQAVQSRDLFRNISQFSITKFANNPIVQRDAFINEARDAYDGIFEVVAPAIAFTIRKGTDFERLEEQAKEVLKHVEETSYQQEEALAKSRANAEQTVEAIRKIAQEAGVSQHFVHFRNEADLNAKSATPWLIAAIGIASFTVVLGGLILWRYLYKVPDLTPSQSVQVAIPKVFVFSVLLSATIWAGKTYRAYRHNAVVNRHRQNALATFEAFAKAASDDETKNAVLLQATQCIFSPQQTGYVHGEPEVGMPPVLEIVRNLGKSGG